MTTRIVVERNVAALCEEGSRYALDHVQATQGAEDTVWIASTNGKALSLAKCQGTVDKVENGSVDDPLLIPAEVVPKVKAGGIITDNGVFKGQWGKPNAPRLAIAEHPKFQGKYPDVSKVLPEIDADKATIVTLDPKLLADLATAIVAGPDDEYLPSVTLIISHDDKLPIAVTGRNGFGVIMPCEKTKKINEVENYNHLVEEYKASL